MGLGAEEWVLNGNCGRGWVVPLLKWRNRKTEDFLMLDGELEAPFCVVVEQVVVVRVAFCQFETEWMCRSTKLNIFSSSPGSQPNTSTILCTTIRTDLL